MLTASGRLVRPAPLPSRRFPIPEMRLGVSDSKFTVRPCQLILLQDHCLRPLYLVRSSRRHRQREEKSTKTSPYKKVHGILGAIEDHQIKRKCAEAWLNLSGSSRRCKTKFKLNHYCRSAAGLQSFKRTDAHPTVAAHPVSGLTVNSYSNFDLLGRKLFRAALTFPLDLLH